MAKMFDIRQSDIRRSKALHYKNPYQFISDMEKLYEVDGVDRHHYLCFTRNGVNRFELQLRNGSIGDGNLVTYTLLNGKAIPIYKDPQVKGDLIWLDKSDTKENEDGTVTIFKKVGLVLVQRDKYFGYDVTSDIYVVGTDSHNIQHHIYGYGAIMK